MEEHHRFLLRVQLRRLQAVEEDLDILEQRIQEKLKPYAAQSTLLQEIPGIDETLAAAIIAELGVDMSVFGNVSQLASWAGVCPGNNESAGKRKSSRIPKGNVYLNGRITNRNNVVELAPTHVLANNQSLPLGTQPVLVFVRNDGQLVSGYCDIPGSAWEVAKPVKSTDRANFAD